jgi:hypothetical protein
MSDWSSFYVMVGSSGAALIGIQFVVITLIAGMPRRPTAESLSAFGTPTMVHLVGALVVSAIMSAPWHSLFAASVALMISGICGIAYGAIVIRRALRQTYYLPVWQDWVWYGMLPCGVYAALALGAAFLRSHAPVALFVIAAATLGLLLIGIHNAWDTVTHIVASESGGPPSGSRADGPSAGEL